MSILFFLILTENTVKLLKVDNFMLSNTTICLITEHTFTKDSQSRGNWRFRRCMLQSVSFMACEDS